MRRWKGLKSLIHDAIDHTTRLVEEGHESAMRGPMRVASLIPEVAEPARVANDVRRLVTSGVLASVRGVNRLVESVTDVGIEFVESVIPPTAPNSERPVAMRSDAMGGATWMGDAALGAVNAAVGDYLERGANQLAVEMAIRWEDSYLSSKPEELERSLADTTPKWAIFVHGLGTTEWSWCLNAAEYHGDPSMNFGRLLARDLAMSPLYVRYNTGRHISQNGRELSERLEQLVKAVPHTLEEIVLLGHSMGGLVVRSACHYAKENGHTWLEKVKTIVCLGSPHLGAPLEKLAHVATAVMNAIDLPGTRIPGRILQGRSAGIKDLRHGSIVDDDWLGIDPDALRDAPQREIPLLDSVRYAFVSATLTRDENHPVGQLLGDLLVRVPSASGPASSRGQFKIETERFGSVMHHQLQNHPDVYLLVRRLCRGDAAPESTSQSD